MEIEIKKTADLLLNSGFCTPKLNKILGLMLGMYPNETCARDKDGDVYLINEYGKFLSGHIHDFITESVGMARHLNIDPEKYKKLGLAIEKMPLTEPITKPKVVY